MVFGRDMNESLIMFVLSGARDLREAWQSGAVPVIHLDQGKASVDQYLRMFPEQFLGEPQVINKISQTKLFNFSL